MHSLKGKCVRMIQALENKISFNSWHSSRVSETYISTDCFGSKRKKDLIRHPKSPASWQSNWDAPCCAARQKQPKPLSFLCELGRSELQFLPLILTVQSLVSKKWCKYVHTFPKFIFPPSCCIFRLGQLRENGASDVVSNRGKTTLAYFF